MVVPVCRMPFLSCQPSQPRLSHPQGETGFFLARTTTTRSSLALPILVICVLLACALAVVFGATTVSPQSIMSGGALAPGSIVRELRVPRVLLAFGVGGTLAVAGAALQALLRNPLAEPWLLGLAIGLWVGGFDILYACQDLEFDRGHGLLSIPTRFGVRRSIVLSRVMHVATIAAMVALWRVADLPPFYLVGVFIVAVLLTYEQSLVSDDDLSQVKKAFDLNGYVGIVYFVATAVSLYLR